MKFKKVILAFMAAVFACGLAACSKNLSSVTTSLHAKARRDKITLVTEFTDKEQRIFKNVTPAAYLYEYEKGKRGDEVEYKTLQNATDDQKITEKTTSKEVIFENLKESTEEKVQEYQIVVKATVDGYAYDLASEVVKMSDEGTKENPIEIKTAEEFLEIKYDREGHYYLGASIDFAPLAEEEGKPYALSPMFITASNSFKGSIDGKNNKISNFSIASNNQYNGLIGYLEGSISNLVIENASITTTRTSETNTGLLVGYNAGAVVNCDVKNSEVNVESSAYSLTYPLVVGGLVGSVDGNNSDIEVRDCDIDGLKLNVKAVHRATIGGMIGQVLAPKTIRMGQKITNNTIKNLTLNVNQENKTKTTDDILIYVGGFVGQTARTINESKVEGNISVTTKLSDGAVYDKKEGLKTFNLFVGGFAGLTVENSRGVNLDKVEFTGSISVLPANAENVDTTETQMALTQYVGGLVGALKGLGITNSKATLNTLTILFHEDKPVEENKEAAIAEDAPETPVEKPEFKGAYGLLVGYTNDLTYVGNTATVATVNVKGVYTETKLDSQSK